MQSLCGEWTVREVAAHLTLSTRDTLVGTLVGVLKARGSWDRANSNAAKERARRYTPAELIAQIRETAGSARRAPGAGPLDPLADFLVHGQDIARPLGRTREMPIEPAVASLDHIWNSRFYGARKRFKGQRVVASDADWSAGEGAEIKAPVTDLLLAATGRSVL
ncbi:maleylpyruvate isomerase family mycothiol-dependent enzyme [Spirillospora sp. NPDC047279]|uniref:maleylpyruvate isomerase family mycothiol-dependent enzyme n=1 Tax=Spirillospora sp. NPDC047279 TaxID=3155478 RepID=UPI0033D32EB3